MHGSHAAMRVVVASFASFVLFGCAGPSASGTRPHVASPAAPPSAAATSATTGPTTTTAGPTTYTHPDHPGLEITDVVVGTGAVVKAGDPVEVSYVGTLDDGTVFDEAKGARFTIGIGMLIKGWDAGVPGMRVGGTRKLHVPASLAYGSKGAGNKVPPYAALDFTIEVTRAGN